MNYQGYLGLARVDTDAGVIRGRVINTRDMITFQGKTVAEAEAAFRDSVDDYLESVFQRAPVCLMRRPASCLIAL